MIKSPTDEQREIIDYPGNIVVTAKPGSGKTFTIVEKIANVLPDLPDYKGVIAISFTNKASDELKSRCKQRCKDTKQSFFGTIDKFYLSQIIMPFPPRSRLPATAGTSWARAESCSAESGRNCRIWTSWRRTWAW